MSELSKLYDPAAIESKWYAHWEEKGFFNSDPDDREPYTIVIPPPNVTGRLHMGHVLNNTLQDLLIRRARMQGKNACWVPGTDHASIATEAKVVNKLREKGIAKSDIGREAFLEEAMQWKEEYGGIILDQLKKLGASCDWRRTRFTMEEKLSDSVIKVFVALHEKGCLYRDLKMINWDPKAKTTLSNEEVIYKEEASKLYHLRYRIVGTKDEWLTIATTRPETILGDTAICVHPEDDRYKHLAGKKAIVPLVEREIPVIFDEYVDREFGTGALKVTPAHDTNDYELGKKHNLQTIDIFNADATMSEAAEWYIGQDRFEVRKQIVPELDGRGHLVETEDLTNKVGYSERNMDTVVEPRLSMQWFVDMQRLVGPALENVMNDEVQLIPEKFKNTYRHWMENIRDWPISRQLWWGQQIPAWYYGEGADDYAVAETEEEALSIARQKSGNPGLQASDLRRDEDVVDTWFSSWLWPISVFDGILEPDNDEINYYYPTNVLVTGWDIIFFWVARMVMAGYEYRNERPFQQVYFTGMVRDMQRRKMSKSLGNSPEPLDLIDQYGADGVRFGILSSAPAGNDILFNDKLCEQGRNFCNKLWNALRLIRGWEVKEGANAENQVVLDWFSAKLDAEIERLEESLGQFRLSEGLMNLYNFIWGDFCSWYLEMIKPEYGQPIDRATLDATIGFYERLVQLLHPFMPFITEEIWHALRDRAEGDCCIVSRWPSSSGNHKPDLIATAALSQEFITKVREIRNKYQIKNKTAVDVFYMAENDNFKEFRSKVVRAAGLGAFDQTESEPENTVCFPLGGIRYFVSVGTEFDKEGEKQKIEEELSYTRGFIKNIEKKLSNDRFVQNAPADVVDKERKKLDDGIARLKALEDTLANLN